MMKYYVEELAIKRFYNEALGLI